MYQQSPQPEGSTATRKPAADNGGPAPSPYQQRVLEFVEHEAGHGVVEATAGSGKTTTLVQVARLLAEDRKACFLAFNRATAAELRARLPAHVEATTIHALGRATLVGAVPALKRRQPDEGKYRSLALTLVLERGTDRTEAPTLADYLARLARFTRLELTDVARPEDVGRVTARYGLESPVTAARTPELHALLPELRRRGVATAQDGVVDFTDMLFVPLALGLQPPRFGFVCVDEAQDLSPLTLALVMRLVEGGARALFVGDPKQAIYGFAGADRRSLQRVARRTGATILPLSVSFRCPTRHVTLARRFSPDMQPAPGASTGVVRVLPLARLARAARPGDLIMCRVNAPLVELCLRLTEVGTPARVLGTDLAGPLLELAGHLFPGPLPPDAAAVVARHARTEARRLEAELLTSPALGGALERNTELHEALGLLLRRTGAAVRSLGELERLARALFVSDDDAGSDASPREAVVLSTIHKAKGREARRVFLLFPEELAPAPASGQPRPRGDTTGNDPSDAPSTVSTLDEEAEANVLFVALTRAKEELILVERTLGALAWRLDEHRVRRRAGSHDPESLATRWSEALSLAQLMARRTPNVWRRFGSGRHARRSGAGGGGPGGRRNGG